MSDQDHKKNLARRNLLKSLVAGGGVLATGKMLPASWSRPVVESVLLPAHAQTSGGFDGVYRFDVVNTVMNRLGDGPKSVLDLFVSPAQAAPSYCANVARIQFRISGGSAAVCVSLDGGDSALESTGVDQDNGDLQNVNVSAFSLNLFDMQVDPAATRIDGNSDCGLFTARRTSLPFQCANITASLHLSSPYRKA